jgi:hypothetical protein
MHMLGRGLGEDPPPEPPPEPPPAPPPAPPGPWLWPGWFDRGPDTRIYTIREPAQDLKPLYFMGAIALLGMLLLARR